ncbi:MAG: MOSC domain-containing protein [Candidatus Velthaea sp.]
MSAAIVSVNIGGIRKLRMPRGEVDSAIVKLPATVPVALRGNSLVGDKQANRKYHGGPDRAVYAYASEDYRWWEARLGRRLEPGTFGENLTTAGIDVNAALIGERWAIGRDAVLEVSMPRVPCSRLAARMGDPAFVATFAQALRLGPYFRIVTHGDIAAGDAIRVTSRPEHGIRLIDAAQIYLFERQRLGELLAAPQIGAEWTEWIIQRIGPRAAT